MIIIMIRSFVKNLIEDYKKNKDLKKIENVVLSIKEKRLALKFLDILKDEVEKEIGVLNIKFESAYNLDNDQKNKIEKFFKEKFKDKKVKIDFKENKNLLGGFKIYYNDKILDYSLINFINKIWRSF
jgi:F0F1-type ATP synthase delta subunit